MSNNTYSLWRPADFLNALQPPSRIRQQWCRHYSALRDTADSTRRVLGDCMIDLRGMDCPEAAQVADCLQSVLMHLKQCRDEFAETLYIISK